MTAVDTDDLAVMALAGGRECVADEEETGTEEPVSAIQLGERMEMGADGMADRIELLSTVSELEDQGLIRSRADGENPDIGLRTGQGAVRFGGRSGDRASQRDHSPDYAACRPPRN